MRIILASASPRRKELLGKLFAAFEIIPAQKEESCAKQNPDEAVQELSRRKAAEIEQLLYPCGSLRQPPQERRQGRGPSGGRPEPENDADYLIIGADTVAAQDGQLLGKPRDEQDAADMLRMLSGKTHQVYTGVAMILKKGGVRRCLEFTECTEVVFYPMTEKEITDYIKSGEPMDKAGSYGIQGLGGRFVKRIDGSYDNVVGLPAAKIYQALKEAGFSCDGNVMESLLRKTAPHS